jgi:hypothetical protein
LNASFVTIKDIHEGQSQWLPFVDNWISLMAS